MRHFCSRCKSRARGGAGHPACRDPRDRQAARTKAERGRVRRGGASGDVGGGAWTVRSRARTLARPADGGPMARLRVRLVVTADDFGYCPRRDEGIVEAFLAGAVTSVSLLVNGSAAESAAELARR